MRSLPVLFASSLLVSIALAACGGGSAEAPPAQAPNAPSASAPHMRQGNGGASTLGTVAFSGAMKPVVPSAMLADLQAIGLDPKALPPLEKLEPEKLRKVMKTFSKSLGVVCTDCHVENDFRAPTPRKNIAAQMWNQFTSGLTLEDGSPAYCDSCHQGSIGPLLDRKNKKALSAWMDENFVGKLKRRDGKEHSCETCHGDPFEGKFVAAWAKADVKPLPAAAK